MLRRFDFWSASLSIVFLLTVASPLFVPAQDVPFNKGVNLTGWFQAGSPEQIQFSRFTRRDFENIKSLGCDVIRLPINLEAMTTGAPDFTPQPLFLHFLDQVVNWSEELGIYLIIDNHTFDPASNTDPAVENFLINVWTKLARHYKEEGLHIYYEILNEPHGIDDAVWGNIQQKVIDAIRAEDDRHWIVVGPANWNSYHNLADMPNYSDDKLLYTFHFYDPFVFTHQGASWVDPSMVPLAGVPFPYDAAKMPPTPTSLKGSWIESALGNYRNEGNADHVRQLIDIAANFRTSRNVPVFCGEFGVYKPNSPQADRIRWYDVVRKHLEARQIPWTIWDYTGGFGLFELNSSEFFDHDLNVPLLDALGFVVPPQTDYIERPLTNGFDIYTDDLGSGIVNSSNTDGGTLSFYSEEIPYAGDFCIYWTGVSQYSPIGFDFQRDLDLQLLKEHDFTLEFRVRTNSSTAKFDVRFLDTKEGNDDRPWRMGKTISGIPADNQWHWIQIPLKELEEKGAWDGSWFPPDGEKFDWTSVDKFEIIPEHQSLAGIEFSFDNIRISGEEIVLSIADEQSFGARLFPNPTAGGSSVEYELAEACHVEVIVTDARGVVVERRNYGLRNAGPQHVLVGSELGSGLYIVTVKAGAVNRQLRMIIAN